MLNNLQKLAQLSAAEGWTLVKAWAGLAVASTVLRCGVSLPRAVARLDRVQRARGAAPDVQRVAWAVAVASRHHLLPARCLERSLTLRYLLARAGVASDLRIGARSDGGGLEAHAWVEIQGQPIAEAANVQRKFPPLEKAAARRAIV